MNRRQFLRSVAVSLGAAAVGGSVLPAVVEELPHGIGAWLDGSAVHCLRQMPPQPVDMCELFAEPGPRLEAAMRNVLESRPYYLSRNG